MGFCYEDELMTGDFDEDGRSDLVCRKDGGEKYQIALSGRKIGIVLCSISTFWYLNDYLATIKISLFIPHVHFNSV